jgi:hypothetical protein
MAMFVHVTTAEKARAVKRAGLKPGRAWRSLFAMPVVPNFVMTHQWTRELQRWSRQRMVGVYFRIPDAETVRVGRFNQPKQSMTAAEASALARTAETLGFEVEILRPIGKKDIHAVRDLRGIVGWRHYPGANGVKPCGCPACVMRGEPGGRRLRAAFEESL